MKIILVLNLFFFFLEANVSMSISIDPMSATVNKYSGLFKNDDNIILLFIQSGDNDETHGDDDDDFPSCFNDDQNKGKIHIVISTIQMKVESVKLNIVFNWNQNIIT